MTMVFVFMSTDRIKGHMKMLTREHIEIAKRNIYRHGMCLVPASNRFPYLYWQ